MSNPSDIIALCESVLDQAKNIGAEEVSVSVGGSDNFTLTRRDGKIEIANSSASKGLSIDLLIDGRFSSHSTSDLRESAIKAFLVRAFDATKLLTPDPMRALPDIADMGRGASDEALGLADPLFADQSPAGRALSVESLEDAVSDSCRALNTISIAAHRTDGQATNVLLTSNGFRQVTHETWSMLGAEVTLQEDGGKRPEASAWFVHRFADQLPTMTDIADELVKRAQSRQNTKPAASGQYTLILKNRVARQLLGCISQGISGHAIYHKRSSLADKLGQQIASPLLTIIDDPLLPMGLGSTPWSDDLLVSKKRTIVDAGVLSDFNLGLYYARKLDRPVTTKGSSNWLIQSGEQSWQSVAKAHPKAILVDGFLGGNANPATGEFSFGVQGALLHNGENVHNVSEMNISGEITQLFKNLVAVGDDTWTWGSTRSPTLIFADVSFSGT